VGEPKPENARANSRLKVAIRGAVQGVGFRPFVFRLAKELRLAGWVNNSAQGVFIEVEGPESKLKGFLIRLETEKPPRSFIQSLESSWLDPAGFDGFTIRESEASGVKTALILPDIATCPDCLSEILDPRNRRYFYPFTNCTNCGPRFSIISALPYDRANTSMKAFTMCPDCQREYDDPVDRRFHAQPNACPACGPHLELWDAHGACVAKEVQALNGAAQAIRTGKILAAKGLGGFHLMVAAHDEHAVCRLRQLKHREEKPLALMLPSLEGTKSICGISALEERLLLSPEAPIVLLHRIQTGSAPRFPLATSIAPNNPNLGVMLPYTPLHHLLMSLLEFPVVATSGNLSDEPICIDEREALERLRGIADLFVVHNRPILRHVDDSVVRVLAGREQVIRRARGYAPLPIALKSTRYKAQRVLAVGGHLKNAVGLSAGPEVFISQHIGDLETVQAHEAFQRVISDFEKLYQIRPQVIAADAHPDYLSTKFARGLLERAKPSSDSNQIQESSARSQNGLGLVSVQHHVAHALSCMAENEVQPPFLGVSWDGTGYGLDGTIWGGEFFRIKEDSWERLAHFRQFQLPGGDRAVKEPRRAALGLLYELFGQAVFAMDKLGPVNAFSASELGSLKTVLARQINAPLTSSVGRIFDAVASLTNLRQQVRFEGQAAMELEFSLEGCEIDECYPISLANPIATAKDPQVLLVDWSALVQDILRDIEKGTPTSQISARFHNALVEAIILVAHKVENERVVLSGGCFQNRYLTERAIERLREEGFHPYWHQRVPPNDGGICLGQVVAALRETAVAGAEGGV
jgi:hydrogenase maturation protein HypF